MMKKEEGPEPGKALATPAVRRLARDMGLDIDTVPGTGIGGRVTEKDVRSFQTPQRTQAATPQAPAAKAAIAPSRPATQPAIQPDASLTRGALSVAAAAPDAENRRRSISKMLSVNSTAGNSSAM